MDTPKPKLDAPKPKLNTTEVVNMVSTRLREIIHDINNALFVTKGFLEELSDDIKEKNYLKETYDHENIADMVATITRNAEKIDTNLSKLRRFAKEEIYEETGTPKEIQ